MIYLCCYKMSGCVYLVCFCLFLLCVVFCCFCFLLLFVSLVCFCFSISTRFAFFLLIWSPLRPTFLLLSTVLYHSIVLETG